ncbi:MAG: xanthine dehydrogenase family protein molybdopterin-binding subunit [Gammaproteobacteria bacterium]|nr:xanthine dehydrogenase family protein molybdopterin-binding subunit [Gammaproteobacteria bacterium]MCP5199708.1 xanthine dehydrogenase family protein molybdopterin-binding subunit [Gammaproteobacteria bacterium]
MNTVKQARIDRGRRRFLIASGIVGGGLAVGAWWFYRERDRLGAPPALVAADGERIFNAWIKIGDDGRILVQVPRQEMGQGVSTALPMLVAEELDADFADVHYEQAPIAPVYGNATMLADGVPFRPDDHGWVAELVRHTQFKAGQLLGLQATGGSTSVRDAFEPMRRAGATARAMLVTAAARRLGVAESELEVAASRVTHAPSRRSLSFAELAAEAAALPMPDDVALKPRERFTLLGTPRPRLDVPAKVDGSAHYGIDARPPGLVYAAIAQCPVFGGTVKHYEGGDVAEWPGVRAIVELPATRTSAAAVAVVADHYWQAKKALEAIPIEWHGGAHAAHDTGEQKARYAALLDDDPGRVYDAAGDSAAAFAAAARTLEADYHAPYLAHATMEPMNCTTLIRADGSGEVWVGNQAPTLVRWITAEVAGVDSERVTVHTPYLGGGFGRRGEMDVVMQAALIAERLRDTPIQLVWSREEDMRHDLYRPMASARLRAAIDADGALAGVEIKSVGQSAVTELTRRLLPAMASDLMKDKTMSEGLFDLPYAFANRTVSHVRTHEAVPVGFWRSVGHSMNAFFAEGFVDEIAHTLGQDPFEFRRAALGHAPRHRRVLEVAAERAGWGGPLDGGRGRGIALAESFHAVVAQVAEVRVADEAITVERVVCAIDCGFALNPDIVRAQVESAIIFGLSAALHGEISVRNGRVEQGNFPDYRMVGLASTPRIEVHIVESGLEHLGGVGEPGTPPLAPAVANAVFAACGKRLRELPLRV